MVLRDVPFGCFQKLFLFFFLSLFTKKPQLVFPIHAHFFLSKIKRTILLNIALFIRMIFRIIYIYQMLGIHLLLESTFKKTGFEKLQHSQTRPKRSTTLSQFPFFIFANKTMHNKSSI